MWADTCIEAMPSRTATRSARSQIIRSEDKKRYCHRCPLSATCPGAARGRLLVARPRRGLQGDHQGPPLDPALRQQPQDGGEGDAPDQRGRAPGARLCPPRLALPGDPPGRRAAAEKGGAEGHRRHQLAGARDRYRRPRPGDPHPDPACHLLGDPAHRPLGPQCGRR